MDFYKKESKTFNHYRIVEENKKLNKLHLRKWKNDFRKINETLPEALIRIEKGIIKSALKKYSGNKTKVTKHLGITFDQLKYRIIKTNG